MAKRRRKQGRTTRIALRNARRIAGGVQADERAPGASGSEKFIPNADPKFVDKVEAFANTIARDPGRFNITEADAQLLVRRASAFRAAYNRARSPGTRTASTIRDKDDARKEAEEFMRIIANQIRGDGFITRGDKLLLDIKQRPKKLKKQTCPKTPPFLEYLCGIDGRGSSPSVHVLEFREFDSQGRARKAVGAASLHLYFDLIPPGEPVPRLPSERGWPKFLRSYTRNPIHVEFPMPKSGPMLVVYWGRWADAKGNSGPWSEPCVARIEGTLATPALPEGEAVREQRMVIIQAPLQLTGTVEANDATMELAALSQRMLEAATVRLLNAA